MKKSYSKFIHSIDMDAFYESIGFETIDTDANNNDRGQCILPWGLHNNGDTTGKLSFNRDKKCYNCFVCGGGSILSFVMSIKDLDVEDAIDYLYQFTIDTDESIVDGIMKPFNTTKAEENIIPYYNEKVISKWELTDNIEYLKDRGIDYPVIKNMRIGYNPKSKRLSSDNEYIGPSVIIPHFWAGKLVGWQSRWVDKNKPKWVPKYTSTPDMPKKDTLYGYHYAYAQDTKPILVESPMTVLVLQSCGYSAIASFGGTINDEQIKLLRVFSDGIIIAPDNGSIGEKYCDKIKEQLGRYVPISLILPPNEVGADLADLENKEQIINHIEENIINGF